jgi:hypothetical protein
MMEYTYKFKVKRGVAQDIIYVCDTALERAREQVKVIAPTHTSIEFEEAVIGTLDQFLGDETLERIKAHGKSSAHLKARQRLKLRRERAAQDAR